MFDVVRVVIKGEMPKGCMDCRFVAYDVMELTPYDPETHPAFCRATIGKDQRGKEIADNTMRPDWCPLVPDTENI